MNDWIVSLDHFRKQLGKASERFFIGVEHGSMRVELYKPVAVDDQTPHSQDELYIILQGTGTFVKGSERKPFRPGDVIFVEAKAEHRFENFSADFETWVVFWGPGGGES